MLIDCSLVHIDAEQFQFIDDLNLLPTGAMFRAVCRTVHGNM